MRRYRERHKSSLDRHEQAIDAEQSRSARSPLAAGNTCIVPDITGNDDAASNYSRDDVFSPKSEHDQNTGGVKSSSSKSLSPPTSRPPSVKNSGRKNRLDLLTEHSEDVQLLKDDQEAEENSFKRVRDPSQIDLTGKGAGMPVEGLEVDAGTDSSIIKPEVNADSTSENLKDREEHSPANGLQTYDLEEEKVSRHHFDPKASDVSQDEEGSGSTQPESAGKRTRKVTDPLTERDSLLRSGSRLVSSGRSGSSVDEDGRNGEKIGNAIKRPKVDEGNAEVDKSKSEVDDSSALLDESNAKEDESNTEFDKSNTKETEQPAKMKRQNELGNHLNANQNQSKDGKANSDSSEIEAASSDSSELEEHSGVNQSENEAGAPKMRSRSVGDTSEKVEASQRDVDECGRPSRQDEDSPLNLETVDKFQNSPSDPDLGKSKSRASSGLDSCSSDVISSGG